MTFSTLNWDLSFNKNGHVKGDKEDGRTIHVSVLFELHVQHFELLQWHLSNLTHMMRYESCKIKI